jgi:hypothetical protein
MNIPLGLGKAAGVGAAPVNASATVAAGGSGGLSVFAGVVISDKGKPFELMRLTKQNWQGLLGRPLRPSLGAHAGSLRCLDEALSGGDGYVVRVVPKTAKYPVLSILAVDVGTGKNTTTSTALAFGAVVTFSAGDQMAFYIVDGSTSARSLSLLSIVGENGYFTLSAFGTDALGSEYLEKSWRVSLDRLAVDDNGDSLFIADVLARSGGFLRCDVSSEFSSSTSIASIDKTPFIGATSGLASDIDQEDWAKSCAVISNAMVGYTAVVGLGITDAAVIEKLVSIANARRIDAFMDVAGTSYASAVAAVKAMAFNHENLCLYFFPYKSKDPHFGGHAHWGISGIAFTAKAAGVAKVEGAIGGWHYSPAGVDRAIIPRKEPIPFDNLDAPDEELMYKARLNKLGLSDGGLLMIDDAITTRQKEDYLRFQHVGSVMNAIVRDFYALAKAMQHEPDGVAGDGLRKRMKNILDGYVASEALVKPRDPEDGTEPYVLTVEQTEFDLWTVKWSVCVTGTSRRIMGIPALFR